jgi:YD repeat-containing protein
LNRPLEITSPDGSVTKPTYNEANLLEGMAVQMRGAAEATTLVTNIDYDAKGQRTRIEYGNGVSTTYTYDPRYISVDKTLDTSGYNPSAAETTGFAVHLRSGGQHYPYSG